MKSKISKAQISLEYLLILAISFSLLAIFISSSANFIDSLTISLEKQKAEQFIHDFEQSINEISLFADGSTKIIAVPNSVPWDFYYSNGIFTIIMISDDLHSQKLDFILETQLISDTEQFHCIKCSLQLAKENNSISLLFNDKP